MKLSIYNFLVNTHPGIRERYHNFHDEATGIKKYLSWFYLLVLNFCYYILQMRFLDKKQDIEIYEEKELLTDKSESEQATVLIPGVEEYISKLKQYDVISFDIFDTLIFRPFSEPTDLFFFLGEKLSFMDFKRIRMEMEYRARQKNFGERGHYEISLAQIWDLIEQETGLSATDGMALEQELEQQFCYANPFMKAVYDWLLKLGKEIIIVSDMYLPSECLEKILQGQGYTGYRKLYVSCEYGKNKASGELYNIVHDDIEHEMGAGQVFSVIHVGDNPVSDHQMAQKAGWAVMSVVIGGAYRGIVQNHIWNGLKKYSMAYEYGYIYGGLFVLGYCQYIHRYARENSMDKILFLSRDGDILKQVYDRMYPDDCTEYVYWSRRAATKLLAVSDKYDYFRRFVYHKVNQGYTIRKILEAMELLDFVMGQMDDGQPDTGQVNNGQSQVETLEQKLTDKNADVLVEYLQACGKVLEYSV